MGVRVCPRFRTGAKTEIPDLEISAAGFHALVDVSVVWSAGKEGARRDVSAQRSAKKGRLYGSAAAKAGAVVFPFVVEATGAIGDEANRLIDIIAGIAEDYIGVPALKFRNHMADVIAIAIQRGNAALVQRALQHVHGSEVWGVQ